MNVYTIAVSGQREIQRMRGENTAILGGVILGAIVGGWLGASYGQVILDHAGLSLLPQWPPHLNEAIWGIAGLGGGGFMGGVIGYRLARRR